jgi:hypothetical protein
VRILYVGQLCEGGTCLDRLRALQGLGVTVVPFDITPYHNAGSRLLRTLGHRLKLGPYVRRLNKDLVAAAESAGALTHVWIDKGVWVWPETLHRVRQHTGAALVHFTWDSQFVLNRSRYFVRAVPLYDVLFTTKRFELDAYRRHGARSVRLTSQAFDACRFDNREPSSDARIRYASDVCFIGHHELHYEQRVRVLVDRKTGMRVWGNRWPRAARRKPWLRRVVAGDGLWGEAYPQALRCAKIALGLLSKWIPETVTTRSVEIPACGTMLVAERTPDHQALFEEGKEAEFFGSDEELQDKVTFYLRHDECRERMARAGRRRCLDGGYSVQDRVPELLRQLP